MAFPASPSNNDVHKEGNRAFVWDSTLGVWDQVREADRSENKTITSDAISQGNLTVVGDIVPSTPMSHRNMIINGAMQVNQRGDAGTTTTSGFNGADRFETRNSGTGPWQIIYTTPDLGNAGPDGIRNSFKLAFDPSYNIASPAAADNLYMRYMFEAQDLQHLQYGTASAKAITLSFYVRTNMNTGGANTFSVSARAADGSDKNIGNTYTVANSNWNRYTWTIPGDTAGQIDNNTGRGMIIYWKLVSGSNFTSVSNTSWANHANNRDAYGHTANLALVDGQYWEITGVQLELGSAATPFEHRSYGDELRRCQRYMCTIEKGIFGHAQTVNQLTFTYGFPVKMRATPSLAQTTDELKLGDMVSVGQQMTSTTAGINSVSSADNGTWHVSGTIDTNFVPYRLHLIEPASGDATFQFTAEL